VIGEDEKKKGDGDLVFSSPPLSLLVLVFVLIDKYIYLYL
jgi:hypothetical protein